MLFSKLRNSRPAKAPATATGVPRRTENGSDQLSYWAARIRKTQRNEKAKIATGDTPFCAFCSWNDMPLYSYPISSGMVWAKTSSIAFMAWAELKPGAAEALSWAERYRLKRRVNSGPTMFRTEVSVDSGTV